MLSSLSYTVPLISHLYLTRTKASSLLNLPGGTILQPISVPKRYSFQSSTAGGRRTDVTGCLSLCLSLVAAFLLMTILRLQCCVVGFVASADGTCRKVNCKLFLPITRMTYQHNITFVTVHSVAYGQTSGNTLRAMIIMNMLNTCRLIHQLGSSKYQ